MWFMWLLDQIPALVPLSVATSFNPSLSGLHPNLSEPIRCLSCLEASSSFTVNMHQLLFYFPFAFNRLTSTSFTTSMNNAASVGGSRYHLIVILLISDMGFVIKQNNQTIQHHFTLMIILIVPEVQRVEYCKMLTMNMTLWQDTQIQFYTTIVKVLRYAIISTINHQRSKATNLYHKNSILVLWIQI